MRKRVCNRCKRIIMYTFYKHCNITKGSIIVFKQKLLTLITHKFEKIAKKSSLD